MSVRAKMQLQNIEPAQQGAERGKGFGLYFTAVYEGSPELQKISENAIFGEATPNGNGQFFGPIEQRGFERNEEYYLDLVADGDFPPGGPEALTVLRLRKSFRGEYQYGPKPTARFSFVSIKDATGGLTLAITNEPAIAYLDSADEFSLFIRLAVGVRPAAEIALREAEVERWRGMRDSIVKNNGEPYYDALIAQYEKKLARAKGEAVGA